MKEDEMRSPDLVQENEILHDQDVRDIFADPNEFIEVPCPACEKTDNKKYFEKKGFRFVTCDTCGTLYVNPRPTKELLVDDSLESKDISPFRGTSAKQHLSPKSGKDS